MCESPSERSIGAYRVGERIRAVERYAATAATPTLLLGSAVADEPGKCSGCPVFGGVS